MKSIYALLFACCSCLTISKTLSGQDQLIDNFPSLSPTDNIEEINSDNTLRRLDPVTRLLMLEEMLRSGTEYQRLESRLKRSGEEEARLRHLPIQTRVVSFGYRLEPEDRAQNHLVPIIKAMRYGKKSSYGFS